MHVRKFESETLEEALKQIKRELGPDAIILKTVTNKGLKGAFKKKRIEITAAISEKNYSGKMQVEKSLTDEQRDQFYKADASYISKSINNYQGAAPASASGNGYGNLALNKTANTKSISGLDEFLNDTSSPVDNKIASDETSNLTNDFIKQNSSPIELTRDEKFSNDQNVRSSNDYPLESNNNSISEREEDIEKTNVSNFDAQADRIETLEKKLFELAKYVDGMERSEPIGMQQLRNNLKSLDINNYFINDLIRKMTFELSPDDCEDIDLVFEFALRNMIDVIKVKMPAFSLAENNNNVTMLISDDSCGQSSFLLKLSALKNNSIYIKYNHKKVLSEDSNFAKRVYSESEIEVNSLAELISQIRKANENNQSVFVDVDFNGNANDEAKSLCDSVKRSFDNVEIFLTLSAIHSEVYNRNVINTLGRLANGINLSYLDKCLNYGALFNISYDYPELPFCFFGTGRVVPDDIESATAERILAGMFRL